MVDIGIDSTTVTVLGVCASPRKNGNTEKMLKRALEGASRVQSVKTEIYLFSGKRFLPCIGCMACWEKGEGCVFKDDLRGFIEAFVSADGLIIASPVYHMSVTSQLKCALERLGHSMKVPGQWRPRYTKAGGALVQGTNHFGGQEFAASFIINSLLLMNCVPVAGDVPLSYFAALGSTSDFPGHDIGLNEQAMKSAENLGQRVAELAKIIKAGMETLGTDLPQEYHTAGRGGIVHA